MSFFDRFFLRGNDDIRAAAKALSHRAAEKRADDDAKARKLMLMKARAMRRFKGLPDSGALEG